VVSGLYSQGCDHDNDKRGDKEDSPFLTFTWAEEYPLTTFLMERANDFDISLCVLVFLALNSISSLNLSRVLDGGGGGGGPRFQRSMAANSGQGNPDCHRCGHYSNVVYTAKRS
jgi:hypothetical protein